MSLPNELITKILFKHKGLEHKTAKIIKDYMNKNRMTEFNNIDWIIDEYIRLGAKPGESIMDWAFIWDDLIDSEDPGDLNRYIYIWAVTVEDWLYKD